MKLREVLVEWVPVKRRQVKISTLTAYDHIWRSRLEPRFGDTEIESITRREVRAYAYELMDSGLGKKAIKDILIVLKMLLRFAADEYDVNIPSLHWKIDWPTDNRTGVSLERVPTYSPDEVKRIIAWIKDNPSFESLGILISLCAGLRIGEVSALQWDDIDLERKVIKVTKTLERVQSSCFSDDTPRKSVIYIGNTKTKNGTREVPIAKDLVAILKNFKSICRPEYYVITGTKKFIEPRIYRLYSVRMLRSAGIENVKVYHGLRHTFATNLINAGVDVKTVSVLMGHSNISTTMDLYVHPSAESKSTALNKALKSFL